MCELVTELLQEIVEQPDILRREAEAILSGIVMDTKNFTIRTGERTFEAAAFLRRAGADTTEVKKLLQNNLEDTVARYKILQSAKLYKGLAVAVQPEPQNRVVAAQAVGRARGIGTVDVYVAEERGLPAAEVLEGLQAELQEKREIAVDVQVKAPTVREVDVTVTVAPAEGADFEAVKAAAEKTLTTFFTGRLLGKAVRLAELGSRLYALEGVENYRFTAPAADVAADDTVLPVLGALTVTEMEA